MRKLWAVLAIVMLGSFLMAPSSTHAQTSGPEKWAVIVGCDYDGSRASSWGDMAKELATELEPVFGEGHIKVLADNQASKTAIQNVITGWLDQNETRGDIVLFYFAGHASNDYLFPYNFSPPSRNGISASDLDSWFRRIESRNVTIVLETSNSANFILAFSPLPRDGRIVIAATGITETSQGNLTRSILSTLRLILKDNSSEVDANHDGIVSIEEIYAYSTSAKMYPEYLEAKPSMSDKVSGEMPFINSIPIKFRLVAINDPVLIDESPVECWSSGYRFTYTAPSTIEIEPGVQWAFESWGDEDTDLVRRVEASEATTYIARYVKQYYLNIDPNFPIQHNSSAIYSGGWYDEDSRAVIGRNYPDIVYAGSFTRYIFAGWSGDSTDLTPETVIRMNSPKKLIAHWGQQHLLTIISEYGNQSGAGWYDAGTKAKFGITQFDDTGRGSLYKFAGWTGDILSSSVHDTIDMDSPHTVIANWKPDRYELVLSSEIENYMKRDWLEPNSKFTSDKAPEIIDEAEGIRYVLLNWEVDGEPVNNNPVSIIMDSPHRIKPIYEKQIHIAVESEYGEPLGTGWYPESSEFTISIKTPKEGIWVRKTFEGWDDWENGPLKREIVISEPTIYIAKWKDDYSIIYLCGGICGALVLTIIPITYFLLRRPKRSAKLSQSDNH